MEIRAYQPGDEVAQVEIYNDAAGTLPKFKAATLDEVRRRARGAHNDPSSRFLAVADGRPVGYAGFQSNGRVSYPWCCKGHEAAAQPLFERVLQVMKERGFTRAFTAYRADWTAQQEFFRYHGFQKRREMVNYVLDTAAMPKTTTDTHNIGPATPEDVPAIVELGANVLLIRDRAALKQYLFHNPYFPSDSVLVLRERTGGSPRAVGILITNANHADPRQVDPAMPCFRLGAFGTEGMTTKRINGLFSFLTADTDDTPVLALGLLNHAANRLENTEVRTIGAQAPSDAGHLLRFYEQYFQRQASFPILERSL